MNNKCLLYQHLKNNKVDVPKFFIANNKDQLKEAVIKLNERAFYFQKIISNKVRTSRIPKIKFYLDKSSEFQRQIDELIDEVSFEK